MYGSRIIEWEGNMNFVDKKNNLCCKISFYNGASIFSRRKHPSDHFELNIYYLLFIIL